MPGTSGDHAPVHYAQTEHDEKIFQEIYRDPAWKFDAIGNCVFLDDWKKTPSVWERRFNK